MSPRITAVAALLLLAFTAPAAEPRQRALLIGVQQYTGGIPHLKFSLKDVELMRDTLQKRAGFKADDITTVWDGARSPAYQPTKAAIEKQIREFFAASAAADNADTLLIFFSGHGCSLNEQGYLIAADSDVNRLAETTVPLSAITDELKKRQHGQALLVLDCCRDDPKKSKSSAKGELSKSPLTAKSLPGNQDRFVVLSSCRKDQESYEWDSAKNGVFTRWLCWALEGGGLSAEERRMTLGSVFSYVEAHVPTTAKLVAQRDQNPDKYGTLDPKTPLLKLPPECYQTTSHRMARQFETLMRDNNINSVAVSEFNWYDGAEPQHANFSHPGDVSREITRQLNLLGGKKGDKPIAQYLPDLLAANKGVKVERLSRLPARDASELSRKLAVDAFIDGKIEFVNGETYLTCRLIKDGLAIKTQGQLDLRATIPTPPPPGTEGGSEFKATPDGKVDLSPLVQQVPGQTPSPHPLDAKDWTDNIEIKIRSLTGLDEKQIRDNPNAVDKPFEFRQGTHPVTREKINECAIYAQEGEYFDILVRNKKLDKKIGVILLLDGLNFDGGQHDPEPQGQPYVLDPGGVATRFTMWYEASASVRKDGALFRFTELNKSFAARSGYTDKIGVITLLFYADQGTTKGDLGIGGGNTIQQQTIGIDTSFARADKPFAVVTIRYAADPAKRVKPKP